MTLAISLHFIFFCFPDSICVSILVASPFALPPSLSFLLFLTIKRFMLFSRLNIITGHHLGVRNGRILLSSFVRLVVVNWNQPYNCQESKLSYCHCGNNFRKKQKLYHTIWILSKSNSYSVLELFYFLGNQIWIFTVAVSKQSLLFVFIIIFIPLINELVQDRTDSYETEKRANLEELNAGGKKQCNNFNV